MKTLVIEREAVKNNIGVIKERAGEAVIYAVLTGDGQGAGLVELARLLRDVQERFQVTIILIEHHIDLVFDLCSRICVLNLGKVLKIDIPQNIQNDEKVIQSYLGSRMEKNDEQQ